MSLARTLNELPPPHDHTVVSSVARLGGLLRGTSLTHHHRSCYNRMGLSALRVLTMRYQNRRELLGMIRSANRMFCPSFFLLLFLSTCEGRSHSIILPRCL